jgi:membrane fusion protein (multidrug efflux system)
MDHMENKKNIYTIQGLLTYLSLICVFSSCEKKHEATPGMPPVGVTEFTVEPKNIPAVFDFIGFAESSHPVEIRGRVEGYLDKIYYTDGQIVQKDQLLFRLDPRQYEAKVAQSKAEVDRQAAIFENANLVVERLKPLYQQKAASKKDLDNALASQLASYGSLQAAKAQLLDNEIQLGYTTITSPITGLANKSQYREGALISPGANNLLTNVSVLDPIWVYFTVSDNDLLDTRERVREKKIVIPKTEGYEVELIQSNGISFPYKGKVDFNSPSYDPRTGTLLIRAVFQNPHEELRPGEFVRVKVHGAERPNALFVPLRALMQKKSGMFVYLIDAENKVMPQDVSVDQWVDEYQIITNGLKPGDRIVVDGINKIQPGSQVHVTGPWVPSAQTSNEPHLK